MSLLFIENASPSLNPLVPLTKRNVKFNIQKETEVKIEENKSIVERNILNNNRNKKPKIIIENNENTHSKISIKLSKPYFIIGESINGKVKLEINKPIIAKKLILKMKGFERTRIDKKKVNMCEEDKGVIEFEVYNEYFREEKILFRELKVLHKFDNKIVNPGNYEFDFKFDLPSGNQLLPPPFFENKLEKNGDRTRALISYKLYGFLENRNKVDLRVCERLFINDPISILPPIPLKGENFKAFFLQKGRITLSVNLQKNIFSPTESIRGEFSVTNTTENNVESIRVRLVRDLNIVSKSIRKNIENEVIMEEKYTEGVPKKSKSKNNINFQTDYNKMYPSTCGKLIDCRYYIVVQCLVEIGFPIEVKLPIIISFSPSRPGESRIYELLFSSVKVGRW